MTGARFLFTNAPEARVDVQQMFGNNEHVGIMGYVSIDFLDMGLETISLQEFLQRFTDCPEYGRFVFDYTLTTWKAFMNHITENNPEYNHVEIHFFSEREQRPFFIRKNNNSIQVFSHSPFHVAFFDIEEVNDQGNITYEFNEEKYHNMHSKIRPLETFLINDRLQDIERYGVVVHY
jgi:hypothetical protein